MLDAAKPYLGVSLTNVYTDSWEVGGVNWTGRFREAFRADRGYDLLPYLPVVTGRIVTDRETSDRFLNDFRRTIGDLVLNEHYRVFAELAAKNGLGNSPGVWRATWCSARFSSCAGRSEVSTDRILGSI